MPAKRHPDNTPSETPYAHELVLDATAKAASYQGRALNLTEAEFRLLDCLLSRLGEPVSREQLAQALTDGEAFVGERTVDVHIHSLRQKLQDKDLIETVRKVGYCLRTKI